MNLYNINLQIKYINLVQERIENLEKEMKYTKQGKDFYDNLQIRIDELTDLISEMKNLE